MPHREACTASWAAKQNATDSHPWRFALRVPLYASWFTRAPGFLFRDAILPEDRIAQRACDPIHAKAVQC